MRGGMPFRWFSGVSVRLKLLLGFGLTVAVFATAIGATLVLNAGAESEWKGTERWDAATAGAAQQIAGTQAQMRAQSMAVATMDPRYVDDFDAAVAQRDGGAKVVDGHRRPGRSRRSPPPRTPPTTSTTRPCDEQVFPAVIGGDRAAADRRPWSRPTSNVAKVYEGLLKIGDRVTELRAAERVGRRPTPAAGRRPTRPDPAGLGVLIAVGLALLITRSIVRPLAASRRPPSAPPRAT